MKENLKKIIRQTTASIVIGGSIPLAIYGVSEKNKLQNLQTQKPLSQMYHPRVSHQHYDTIKRVSQIPKTHLQAHVRQKDIADIQMYGGLTLVGLATLLYRKPDKKKSNILLACENAQEQNEAKKYYAKQDALSESGRYVTRL